MRGGSGASWAIACLLSTPPQHKNITAYTPQTQVTGALRSAPESANGGTEHPYLAKKRGIKISCDIRWLSSYLGRFLPVEGHCRSLLRVLGRPSRLAAPFRAVVCASATARPLPNKERLPAFVTRLLDRGGRVIAGGKPYDQFTPCQSRHYLSVLCSPSYSQGNVRLVSRAVPHGKLSRLAFSRLGGATRQNIPQRLFVYAYVRHSL